MKPSLLRDLPLLELVAVEAMIRLGSVADAADELSVTPSAISHRLRQIERALGVALVERHGRGAPSISCSCSATPPQASVRTELPAEFHWAPPQHDSRWRS